MEPFKTKCANCGKDCVTYNPDKKSFCSRECEVNYKYADRFLDDRYWKSTPVKKND